MQDPRLSPQARYARRSGEEMSLVAAIFSFVFGDGDPNADFEERRWRALGTLIQARCAHECVLNYARLCIVKLQVKGLTASQVIRLIDLLLVFASQKKSIMSKMKWQKIKDSLTRQGMWNIWGLHRKGMAER